MKTDLVKFQKTPKTMMGASDVIKLYQVLTRNGIDVWLDGGWAGDALLEEQTRPHDDVDIVIRCKDVTRLRRLLAAQGYKDKERDDTRAWNFVLADDKGHKVDVHVITLDTQGNGLYGPAEKGVMYPAASLTGVGKINGIAVKCISAAWLVKFHSGYKLDEEDLKDVFALCVRFGIEYPKGYVHPKKVKFT